MPYHGPCVIPWRARWCGGGTGVGLFWSAVTPTRRRSPRRDVRHAENAHKRRCLLVREQRLFFRKKEHCYCYKKKVICFVVKYWCFYSFLMIVLLFVFKNQNIYNGVFITTKLYQTQVILLNSKNNIPTSFSNGF